jgi:hypothetical protein
MFNSDSTQGGRTGCTIWAFTFLAALAGWISIQIGYMRQHQIERKFAKADFAAVVLREWNDKLDQLKVTGCELSPTPVLSIKDGDATRQWFKVIEYTGPGVRPTYVEKISATPSYDKELRSVIYAAFSGKSAAARARQWLAANHYSEADKDWETDFNFQQAVPRTRSISPKNGESDIGLWVTFYSLEKVYMWNGSAVNDMTDNASFFADFTTAIQKLEH